MAEEHLEDARIKRMKEFIRVAGVHFDKAYEHRPATKKKFREMVEAARKDLRSIGVQLDETYHDQLPLIPEVGVRKVVPLK